MGCVWVPVVLMSGCHSRQCRLCIAGGLIARSQLMASRGRSLRLFHLNLWWLRSCLLGGMLMPLHPRESNRCRFDYNSI